MTPKIFTSASQLETLQLCSRKWFLTFIKKLPRIQSMHFGFGTVLHSAAERYLTSKDLWPEGWDIDPDTKKRLPPAEAALIQVLVQEGIDKGVIERRPNGEVEKRIEFEVDEDVQLRGFIDYHTMAQARIEDHKTSKSIRYLKSANALKTNIQMMVYAFWMLTEFERQGAVPPRILTLCHNQFVKDFNNPEVRKREAEVTPAQIRTFWNDTVLQLVATMKEIATKKNAMDIAEPDKASACNAFGGCDFLTICGGQETEVEYSRRISRMNNPTPNQNDLPMAMTPEDFLNKRKNKAAAAPALAQVNPPKDEAPPPVAAPKAAAAAKTDSKLPPWANPDCDLCKRSDHPGFNKSGKPCRICQAVTGVSTEGYEWEVVDGRVAWWPEGQKQEAVDGPEAKEAKDGGTKTKFVIDDFLFAIQKADEEDVIAQIVSDASKQLDDEDVTIVIAAASKRLEKLEQLDAQPEPEPAPAPEPKPAPREKKSPSAKAAKPAEEQVEQEPEGAAALNQGLVLLIGCAPLKWPTGVVFAEDILAKVDGYWDNLKAFERREALRRAVLADGDLIQSLRGCTVVQQGRDPDIDNLISALLPHASAVVRGTIQ